MNPTTNNSNSTYKRPIIENNNNNPETPPEKKQKIETNNIGLVTIYQNQQEILKLLQAEQWDSKTKKIKYLDAVLQQISKIAQETLQITEKVIENESQNQHVFLNNSFQELVVAIQTYNSKEVSQILDLLFKKPNDVATLLNFLTKQDTYCFYILLKQAYEKENPVIFRQILSHLSTQHPSFLSLNLFQNVLINVFNREKWSDLNISIESRDGPVIIHAIRSLLSSHGEVFYTMLNGRMREGIENNLSFNLKDLDISSKTLFSIFRFLYSGQIKINSLDMAQECLIFAMTYAIPMLIKECNQWISSFDQWDSENIKSIYNLGNLYQNYSWQQAALSAGIYHLLDFPTTSPLRKFMQEHAQEVEQWHYDSNKIRSPKSIVNSLSVFGPPFSECKPAKKNKEKEETNPELAKAIFSFISTNFPNIKKLCINYSFEENFLPFIKLKNLEHLELDVLTFDKNITPWKGLLESKKLKVLKLKIQSIRSVASLFKLLNRLNGSIETLHLRLNGRLGESIEIFKSFASLKDFLFINHSDKKYDGVPIADLPLEKLYIDLPVEDYSRIFKPSLKVLSLPVDESILEKFAAFSQLETLSLNISQKLTPANSKHLLHLPQLRQLNLLFKGNLSLSHFNETLIDEEIFETIGRIPMLEALHLGTLECPNANIFPGFKRWIRTLETLNKLDQISSISLTISENNYADFIYELKKLKNLRQLFINFSYPYPAFVSGEDFLQLPKLEKIIFNHSPVAIKPIQAISKLSYLRELRAQNVSLKNSNLSLTLESEKDLCFDQKVDDLSLKLQSVDNSALISTISDGIENLTSLTFNGHLSDLVKILKQTKKLKKLTLGRIFSDLNPGFMINPEFIKELLPHNLEYLQINCANNLAPEDYEKLSWLENFKNLLYLEIIHNDLQDKHLPAHEDRPGAYFLVSRHNG